MPVDFQERLSRLAKVTAATGAVVSAYLPTRWSDEQQRERVRVFLKNELRRARRAGAADPADLEWIERESDALVERVPGPDARGLALFACQRLHLREVMPVRAAVEAAFVVADRPYLRPLAALLDESPDVLLVLVDAERARLLRSGPAGPEDAVALESEVPGRHRRGGWAQLAQSRYQRHIQDHRNRHFEAVAAALAHLVEGKEMPWIVLAGEPRTLAAFRQHLPGRLAPRVAGTVPGAHHEADRVLIDRALALVARGEREDEAAAAVDAVLTEAAKGGRAVAGIDETLEAVERGAVLRLFLLPGYAESGRGCLACGALQTGAPAPCRQCGAATRALELGEEMVDRVLAGGGTVQLARDHAGLAEVGGLAASLRYPL